MTKLSDLTDEELDQAIALKKQQSKQKPKDYSKQSERSATDLARDFAYGAAKAPWDLGKMLGNVLTGGHIQDIPGYKQYIPWMEENIEKIRPESASAWGDVAQVAGGLVGPAGAEMLGARLLRQPSMVAEALRRARDVIPSSASQNRAYNALNELIEQRRPQIPINERIAQEIQSLHEGTRYNPARLLEEARQGSHEAHHSLMSDLGKLTRTEWWEQPVARDVATQAGRTRSDYLKDYLRRLEEEGFEDVAEAYQRTQSGYRGSKRARKALSNAASLLGKADLIAKALKAAIGQ